MSEIKALCLIAIGAMAPILCSADEPYKSTLSKEEAFQLSSLSNAQTGRKAHLPSNKTGFKTFTGRILGGQVRVRAQPDVDSPIVKELSKDELVVVLGESNDFYAIAPPKDFKAYIFRSFVLDNTVEGNRVNVRLSPNLEAPVIGHLNTGDRIQGSVAPQNSKWLEIAAPENARFYIAKEFIEYAGGPDMKEVKEHRLKDVHQQIEVAFNLSDTEMRKSYESIDFDRVLQKLKSIANDYQDFPEEIQKVQSKLFSVQEAYLQKKLQYLEKKAEMIEEKVISEATVVAQVPQESVQSKPSDKMKMWEPIEQAMFASWKSMHHAKTMDDFYAEQKTKGTVISGIVREFSDNVRNKPGSHCITSRDIPQGYLYSTHINLDAYVGKKVNLVVSSRPNNNFAFPAYYVFEVTH
ncbi:MAG: SH3 domain-containing protein [Simkaniaceae bacterium]|nr:SH3 domain-containing protein [Simkaniaceae bacterium]